jgi:cell division septal protein FtsQ
MKPLFIILAESNTGAVLLILVLLIVAGIIGYVTAWYYSKSVYTPVIKGLEVDKAELIRQVAGLRDDLNMLNGKIGKLEEVITEKDKEINRLKESKT